MIIIGEQCNLHKLEVAIIEHVDLSGEQRMSETKDGPYEKNSRASNPLG